MKNMYFENIHSRQPNVAEDFEPPIESMKELIETYGYGFCSEKDKDFEPEVVAEPIESFSGLARKRRSDKDKVRNQRRKARSEKKRKSANYFYSTKIGYHYKPVRTSHWMNTFGHNSRQKVRDAVSSHEFKKLKSVYLGDFVIAENVENTENIESTENTNDITTLSAWEKFLFVSGIEDYTLNDIRKMGSSKISKMVDELILALVEENS